MRKPLMAPNDYLHAGSVVSLADISAGFGCMSHLPAGATGFTTIELKSNHLGTARDGTIACTARAEVAQPDMYALAREWIAQHASPP